MSASDNSNDAVNIKELKEIMDDDMELIQDCFADFIEEWPQQYVEIKGAVLEKNAPILDASAHKLKGTLRYLAAKDAADAAYALESAGKENNMADVEQKLSTLKDACQRVVDYINNFNQ
ncbi:MAG: Hpt domain-containing protein [Proteobacteria bacterium]|nr:Hpt domain-containing protein [Pseudomonadota bacterium]MBU1584272.1 Hpt domain-containing protein [Pseudomonadota bacterium]MBU2455660.1 Hpt domain-containing protein [Pseudomonadota bacterium]MBU2629175.1 Hpt domain-containing protein [Pseudomonadota bacterium]